MAWKPSYPKLREPRLNWESDRAFLAFCATGTLSELRAAYQEQIHDPDGEDWKMVALERAIDKIPTAKGD